MKRLYETSTMDSPIASDGESIPPEDDTQKTVDAQDVTPIGTPPGHNENQPPTEQE